MSTDSGTPNDTNEDKKPLRLRLGRKDGGNPTPEEQSEAAPPPPKEAAESSSAPGEDAPPRKISLRRTPASFNQPAAPSGEDAAKPEPGTETPEKSTNPPRMRLRRSTEEQTEMPAETENKADQPETTEGEAEIDDHVFSDDDFSDFDFGDLENEVVEETAEAPKPGQESEPLEPEAGEQKQNATEAEGWEGAPESQLTPESQNDSPPKQETPETENKTPEPPPPPSGLKLRTRDPIGSGNKAPEGMSHGTLTPFERDKAISDEKAASATPLPIPPKAKSAKKEKKRKEPPVQPGKPDKTSPKGEIQSEKKENHFAGLLVLLIALLVLIAILTAGVAMISGWGPFTREPQPPEPTISQQPATTPAIDTGPATPTTPEQIISDTEEPQQDEPLVEAEPPSTDSKTELTSGSETLPIPPTETVPAETDMPEPQPETLLSDDGRPVIRIEDDSPEQILEGNAPVTNTARQPIEDQAPETPQPDPRIASFIENLSISGANANRQIIIYNNTRYERNQFIDFNLGVRFLGIKDRRLYFQDQRGAVYTRQF